MSSSARPPQSISSSLSSDPRAHGFSRRSPTPPSSPSPGQVHYGGSRTSQSVADSEPSNESNLVLPAIFIDNLAKDCNLNPTHTARLRALVHLGSVQPALSRADLATRTYMLGVILSGFEEIKRKTTSDQAAVEDLPALFTDLRIRLEDTFTLTKEQKENSRAVTQDVILQYTRVKFKLTLHKDVENVLRNEHANLRMSNIFGSPSRERVLIAYLKKTGSSVRNALRQDVRDSIHDKACCLKEFVRHAIIKYKRGGLGDKPIDLGFTIFIALLRRFAQDNPQLLNIAESEDGDDDAPVLIDPQARPARKKRKTTSGGRVPQGQDFWSQVEVYLDGYVAQFGKNLAAPAWKNLVNDIIARDERNFPPPTEASVLSTEPISVPTAQPIVHTPAPSHGFSLASLLNN